MDWTAGYASDIEYTAGFYREQSPSHINFACLLNGIEPVPLDQPYSYFELGFGRGVTINTLAASNPQSQFYAADFNPAHVAEARQLAASAQLTNLTLLENSFADLANGVVADLPSFDFMTLHGIYTWVDAENRGNIVKFIARHLKPGGMVYISYNAMPGCSVVLPLQRLLFEHAVMHPNRSDQQIAGATEFVDKLLAAQAGYFVTNPALKSRIDLLHKGKKNYLVHEYLHQQWQPLYHADVARDLAAAKMEYVGSADFPFAYPGIYLKPEMLALMAEITDLSMRETIKDYFGNTSFRRDIFVRGARRLSPVRQRDLLARVGVALLVPRGSVNLDMALCVGKVTGKPEIYNPVLDALAKQTQTLGQLAALPALSGQSIMNLAQVVAFLTASGQTAVFFPGCSETAALPAQRMNGMLAAEARYGDEFQTLCSPLLGYGLPVNLIERIAYLVMTENSGQSDVAVMISRAWEILLSQGRRLNLNGKTLETKEENLHELTQRVNDILKDRLPIWRQLKII